MWMQTGAPENVWWCLRNKTCLNVGLFLEVDCFWELSGFGSRVFTLFSFVSENWAVLEAAFSSCSASVEKFFTYRCFRTLYWLTDVASFAQWDSERLRTYFSWILQARELKQSWSIRVTDPWFKPYKGNSCGLVAAKRRAWRKQKFWKSGIELLCFSTSPGLRYNSEISNTGLRISMNRGYLNIPHRI